jgi:hypothetical protein
MSDLKSLRDIAETADMPTMRTVLVRIIDHLAGDEVEENTVAADEGVQETEITE